MYRPSLFHPAAASQVDHTINFGELGHDGVLGATVAGNLGSPCERIHNAKTHGGWQLQQPFPGDFVWTSPTGRTYRVRARPLIPGWTSIPDGHTIPGQHRRDEGPAP